MEKLPGGVVTLTVESDEDGNVRLMTEFDPPLASGLEILPSAHLMGAALMEFAISLSTDPNAARNSMVYLKPDGHPIFPGGSF